MNDSGPLAPFSRRQLLGTAGAGVGMWLIDGSVSAASAGVMDDSTPGEIVSRKLTRLHVVYDEHGRILAASFAGAGDEPLAAADELAGEFDLPSGLGAVDLARFIDEARVDTIARRLVMRGAAH